MLPKDTVNTLPLCKRRVTLQDREGPRLQEGFYPQSAGGKKKTAGQAVSLPGPG